MARTAVIAGTATSVSNRVSRRQADRWAQQEAEAYPPQAPYPQQAVPAAEPDYTVELERLAGLRDQGVITAEDFDAKKRQLLGI
jgi:hypothetical protein